MKVTLNGDANHRYPGNVNLSFAYVEGESLLMSLKEVATRTLNPNWAKALPPEVILLTGLVRSPSPRATPLTLVLTLDLRLLGLRLHFSISRAILRP